MMGHGRGPENTPEDRNTTTTKKSTENLTAKSEEIENRPFIELERKQYGNWTNKKETESNEFHDDGTVLINVIGQRDKSYKLNGNYILVGEERIKIDFRGDSFAGQMPARYFKISISANDFTLTDEPKGPDDPDGPSTTYNRINQPTMQLIDFYAQLEKAPLPCTTRLSNTTDLMPEPHKAKTHAQT